MHSYRQNDDGLFAVFFGNEGQSNRVMKRFADEADAITFVSILNGASSAGHIAQLLKRAK